MSLFGLTYKVISTPPVASPSSWSVPIGVMTAATIAGLFSLVSLIISKENKTTEFRQAWIDSQRNDIAEVLAIAAALEFAPLEKRSENLVAFDMCFARILLRDNPNASVKQEYKWNSFLEFKAPSKLDWRFWRLRKKTQAPLPWSEVTSNIGLLRDELARSRIQAKSTSRHKRAVIIKSRRLLKAEWDIVKDGERWFGLTRHIIGSFVIIGTLTLAFIMIGVGISKLLW